MQGLNDLTFGTCTFFHLCMEVKFSSHAFRLFETHVPGENIYLLSRACERSPIEDDNFYVDAKAVATEKNRELLIDKLEESDVEKVFVHFLMFGSVDFAIELKRRLKIELNWIFYGADLYSVLERYGKYNLFDRITSPRKYFSPKQFAKKYLYKKAIQYSKFAKAVACFDLFCFWNTYDYHLLRQHFKDAKGYKFFFYFTLVDRSIKPVFEKEDRILINHSGSETGNHLHVINHLAPLISKGQTECIVPLSYGRPGNISRILKKGAIILEGSFQPLLEFMPYTQYFQLLSTVKVAVFGHRRQEAGGNVFMLLALGAKIFLREDNSMLNWLKDQGFIVFSFEKDLKGSASLSPMSWKDMENNHNVFLRVFGEAAENESMRNLLN